MIIFRYLTKQILSSFLAITLVLLVILLSNQFVHNLNDAASGKVTLHAVLMVTAVQIPILLSYMFPLGLFLAILMTVGRLCVDHEMIVLRSCGLSQAQIIGMIMTVSVGMSLIEGGLMLSIEPQMSQIRSKIIGQAVQAATLDKILPGRFQNMGDDTRVMYAGKVDKSKNHFEEVFVALRGPKTPSSDIHAWMVLTSHAIREQDLNGNGHFFVFDQGFRYAGTPGSMNFTTAQFEQFWQRLPSVESTANTRYSTMRTLQLLHRYEHDQHAAAELQWRIMNVLSTPLLAFLAILLGNVNPRKGKFGKFLPAILLYVVYANAMFAAKNWVENETVSIAFGMWWIAEILLTVDLLFLFLPTLKKQVIRYQSKRRKACAS